MSGLARFHESTVSDGQIDHLGHMNVRYYQEMALQATRALASAHGLTPQACRDQGGVLEVRDLFTRHYREQLVGARLAVLGGVLEVHAEGVRVYHELVNEERGERAAVFVHEAQLRSRETRRLKALPEMLAKSASLALVAWPEHGRPRTLDLERGRAAPSLEVVRERSLAMRRERTVDPAECDADGFFASHTQDLVWGGEPLAGRMAWMPVFETEGGGRFGWASMESRTILHALPRAGARIQSFGAEVALERKTSFRQQWAFDVGTSELLCTHSIVNLAFDLATRRSIEIPAHFRAMLETQYHPDLR
jgi:acyl-CoA thioesterase FadM